MTVQELINRLDEIEDKNKEVMIMDSEWGELEIYEVDEGLVNNNIIIIYGN